MKKGQNGRKSMRRLKPTVGCNASKRRRRRFARTVRYGAVSGAHIENQWLALWLESLIYKMKYI